MDLSERCGRSAWFGGVAASAGIDDMMALATFLVLLPGFAVLSVSMPKHYRELFGRAPAKHLSLALRIVGWTLLVLALVPATADSGFSIGVVLWFGLATLAAQIVAMMLTYRAVWWRA